MRGVIQNSRLVTLVDPCPLRVFNLLEYCILLLAKKTPSHIRHIRVKQTLPIVGKWNTTTTISTSNNKNKSTKSFQLSPELDQLVLQAVPFTRDVGDRFFAGGQLQTANLDVFNEFKGHALSGYSWGIPFYLHQRISPRKTETGRIRWFVVFCMLFKTPHPAMMRESNGESFEKTWKDLWQNHVLKNSKCESNTWSVSDLAKCHTAMGIKSFVSIIEFNPPWTTGFCIYVHLLANIMHVSSPFCWIPTKRTTYRDLPIAQQDWQQQLFFSRNPRGLNG